MLGALALGGCQFILDVDAPQCETDTQCLALLGRGFACSDEQICVAGDDVEMPDDGGASELPERWACIEQPRPVIVPKPNTFITITFSVTDFVELVVPEGVVGRACLGMDVTCRSPVLDNVVPNDDGLVVFENLPHAWSGYHELRAPGYIDSLLFNNRPYATDGMASPTMLTQESVEAIARGGGEELDPDSGMVLVTFFDCDGEAADGIRLEQDDAESDERPFYFDSTVPNRDSDETRVSTRLVLSQQPLAVAGFSHVKPGYATMRAVLAATGQPVGEVTVQVRTDAITIAELHAGY